MLRRMALRSRVQPSDWRYGNDAQQPHSWQAAKHAHARMFCKITHHDDFRADAGGGDDDDAYDDFADDGTPPLTPKASIRPGLLFSRGSAFVRDAWRGALLCLSFKIAPSPAHRLFVQGGVAG